MADEIYNSIEKTKLSGISVIAGIMGVLLICGGIIIYLVYLKLNTASAIAFLAGLALILFYVFVNLKLITATLSKRSTKYGLNTTLAIVIVLAIFVFIELISNRYNFRWDTTEAGRYSLSKQTVQILQNLQKEVKAYHFYNEGRASTRPQMEDLLDQYAYHSPKFTYQFVDPDRNPALAQLYNVEQYGTTVMVSGIKQEKTTGLTEEDLTNALNKVIRETTKTVYFLKGHGEKDINEMEREGYSQLKEAITRENYTVKELELTQAERVPEDCTVLVVAGPKADLFQRELDLISKYIENGGKALFLLDPQTVPGMVSYLDQYGIVVGNNLVVDKISRIFGGDYTIPIVMKYQSHDITKKFNIATFFPMARSVEAKENAGSGIVAQNLALTSDNSWAESDIETFLTKGQASLDEQVDKPGPVSVAAISTIQPKEKTEDKKQARIVVFGDSDFVSNGNLMVSGNRDLFLNTVSWLAEEEDLISIRPKDTRHSPVILSRLQNQLILYIPIVVMPLIPIIVGVIVIIGRRRRE